MGNDAQHAEVQGQGGVRGALQEGQVVLRQDPRHHDREWGAFEYINNGTITKELVHLGALDPSFKLTADDGALVGKKYSVAVCFVYRINAQGKISQLHEYLDMEGLKKQFQPSPTA
jgi:hypothetical protein